MRIRNYKGWEIRYLKRKKRFYACKGKEKTRVHETEDEVINNIDRYEKEREKTEKQRAHEETIKNLKDFMFKCDVKDLRYLVYCMTEYCNEATIEYEKGKFRCFVFDPANVCFINIKMPVRAHKDVGYFRFAWNTNMVRSILRGLSRNGEIGLVFDVENNDCELSDGFGEFHVPIIEIEYMQIKTPDLEHTNRIRMKGSELRKYMKYCMKVHDTVRFTVKDDEMLYLEALDTESKMGWCSKPIKQEGKPTKVRYSADYISKLKFKGELLVEYKKDYPLRITDENGNVFVLAPRVETGD